MQLDGNCFYGYVVLDIFNMAYRDEGSILDQNVKSNSSVISISKNAYLKKNCT